MVPGRQPACDLVTNPAVCCHDCLPGLWLPSQPNSITACWPDSACRLASYAYFVSQLHGDVYYDGTVDPGAYYTAKLTFFHDFPVNVWGAYYTNVRIIFEFLR